MEQLLLTPRLTLRPLRAADASDIYAITGDPDIPFMMFFPHTSLAEAAAFSAQAEADWAAADPATREFAMVKDGRIIGIVSLERCPERDAYEIGWIVHRDHRGQGYGQEAATALLTYAFTVLHADLVQAHCDTRNSPSRRLMEKLGMALLDAHGTRTYPQTGITAEECLYVLTRSTFHHRSSSP